MLGLRVRGRGGRDATCPVAASKARFFGAPPRFFAQEQRNGVELAVGGIDFCPGKRRTRTIPRHPPAPRPKSGEERPVYRGSSAHANGGATRVKKRFSLAARHRFFGQAPKKWGRIAGQAIDPLPAYRRTRTKRKTRRGKPLDRVSPLNPLPDLIRAQEASALCGARAGAPPLHVSRL